MSLIALRSGNNRVVLLVGRLALKLPRARSWRGLLYGMLNNINEAGASHRPGACPVLFSFGCGLLLVMRRAQELTDRDFAAFDPATFCAETGLTVEPKADSFGLLSGSIVAVDYGLPQELRW